MQQWQDALSILIVPWLTWSQVIMWIVVKLPTLLTTMEKWAWGDDLGG